MSEPSTPPFKVHPDTKITKEPLRLLALFTFLQHYVYKVELFRPNPKDQSSMEKWNSIDYTKTKKPTLMLSKHLIDPCTIFESLLKMNKMSA